MAAKAFDYQRLHNEIADWYGRSINKVLMYEEPRRVTHDYLQGKVERLSPGDAGNIAYWLLIESIVSFDSKAEHAHGSYLQSIDWRAIEMELMLRTNAKRADSQRSAIGTMPHSAMSLAMAIVAGEKTRADHLAGNIAQGLETGFLGGSWGLPVTLFALQIFFRAWGKKMDVPELDTKNAYAQALGAFDSGDSNRVHQSVLELCEYHVERSRSSTNKVTYEFDDRGYRIYPAEIFAFVALCKQTGIDVSRISYPLLDTPLVGLGRSKQKIFDDSLQQLQNALLKKMGIA